MTDALSERRYVPALSMPRPAPASPTKPVASGTLASPWFADVRVPEDERAPPGSGDAGAGGEGRCVWRGRAQGAASRRRSACPWRTASCAPRSAVLRKPRHEPSREARDREGKRPLRHSAL